MVWEQPKFNSHRAGKCLFPLAGFFEKTLSILVWMACKPIFLGFSRTFYKRCFYLVLSKNKVTNDWTKLRNKPSRAKLQKISFKITQFHLMEYDSMCDASTKLEISLNPILVIAQDTLFQLLGLSLSSRSLLLTGIKEPIKRVLNLRGRVRI